MQIIKMGYIMAFIRFSGTCAILIFFILFAAYKISAIPDKFTLFPNEEDYKVAVDKAPTPIGGYETVFKKIVYPSMAIQTRTEGKVYILVYLSESGEVEDAKIVKGIGGGCDEEALKVIKRTKFTPATQNGVSVKTKFAMALNFKIP
jgi:periplasmic protein TonB